jgi:rRNA-processing protein FCF1
MERRCRVTVLVKRNFFLGPDSGNSNILLFLPDTSDAVCVHECVIRQLLRLPKSCMRVAKGT